MKKCVVIINMFNDEALSMCDEVKQVLQQQKIQVFEVQYSGQSVCDNLDADLVVTLGGDGTVLFAVRNFSPKVIPIFPVNLGEFGFISGINKNQWKSELLNFLNGKISVSHRNMLEVSVLRDGENIFSQTVLNDAVLSVDGVARLIKLDISCDGINFGKFTSDGVIASTATGSTAYCAAAGGPIVDPSLDVFVLNPICAFSLSNRPLVLPGTSVLNITVLPSRVSAILLTCDGQVAFPVKEGDFVRVKKSTDKALLIGCDTYTFYDALRSKLHWSGGPRD